MKKKKLDYDKIDTNILKVMDGIVLPVSSIKVAKAVGIHHMTAKIRLVRLYKKNLLNMKKSGRNLYFYDN